MITTPDPTIGLWFQLEGTTSENLRYEIVDDQGFPAEMVITTGTSETEGTRAFRESRGSFPRRQESFLLRCLQREDEDDFRSDHIVVAELEIDHPYQISATSSPGWKPGSLPQTTTVEDLEIEFIGLAAGVGPEMPFATEGAGKHPGGVAQFRVREGGQPAAHWFADGVEMSDATGNSIKQNSWSHRHDEGVTSLLWNPTLWPDPEGWKMRFEFTRERDSEFSEAELIEIGPVAIPEDGTPTEVGQRFERLGHTVHVKQLEARGSSTERLQLEVEVFPPLLDKQLDLVRAVDQLANVLPSGSSSWSRDSGTYTFHLKKEEPSTEVTVTLVLHASVFVEFCAVPEVKLAEAEDSEL